MKRKILCLAFSCFLACGLARGQAIPPASYALDFNGSNNYVSVNLSSPPANNYTISAWVYLRTGGTAAGTRMAVLSSTTCNASIEFLIHSTNAITDPQVLELGRCSGFNGYLSTNSIPLNTWVQVGVTFSSSHVVSYYINGQPAGTFTDSNGSHNYSFGTAVNLGDNSGRKFDGMLAEAQIWNRVLSPSEMQNDYNHSLVGNETGLYAYYHFGEGAGSATADSAVAGGGSTGSLINNPVWLSFTNVVSTQADTGAGSLRSGLTTLAPGGAITFAPNLSGQTIVLTSGVLTLSNTYSSSNIVSIDASALPGGVTLSGGGSSQIFDVPSGADVLLNCLTLANGYAGDAGGAIYSAGGSTLNISRCTFTGNNALEGGALLNEGVLLIEDSTFSGNYGSYGGVLECRNLTTLIHCTISANNGYYCGGIYNITTLTLNNCIIAANTDASEAKDIYCANAALVFTNANLVQSIQMAGSSPPATGPAPLTSAPLLAPLGNYGGPTQTMPPLSDSPALDVGGPTSLTVDQRGFPRVVGPAPDLGAVELNYSNVAVSTISDSGLGSLRYILSQAPPGANITFATNLSGQSIALSSGQIVLGNSVTIDASALPAGMTINANQSSRLFYIQIGASVVLNSLTLVNGSVSGVNAVAGNGLQGGDSMGGGIYNAGTLTLNQSTLAYNTATGGNGAVNDSGVCNCAYNIELYAGGGYGGGIYNAGNLNLNESTVAFNSAAGGAGGNDTAGEGIYGGSGVGGGIYQAGNYTIQATQSTISANSALTGATGAGDYVFGFEYTNSTVGGGISSDGSQNANLHLFNAILAGNPGGDVSWPAGFVVNPGNIVGVDPGLAPLGNYGGPTPTMPPGGASPAIDAGNDSATNLFATDQRGQPRLSGLHVDSGAVEVTFGMPAITGLTAYIISTNTATGAFTVGLAATITPNSEISVPVNFQYGVSQAYGLGSGPISVPGNYISLTPAANVTYTSVAMSSGYTFHWNVAVSAGPYTVTSPDQTLTLPLNGIPGDLNSDGTVNQADLAILLAHLNGNGTVNQSELSLVYSNYLTTSPWLYITNVAGLGGTNVTFTLTNLISGGYSVQYSTDMVNWHYLGPANPFYGFTDTNAPAQPKRFYRLSYP